MKKPIAILLFVFAPAIFVSAQEKLGMLEYLLNTTVKIQTVDSMARVGDKDISYGVEGTGFFFQFQTEKGKVPAIVTTKQVIQKALTITFLFLEADKAGKPLYGKQQKITIKKTELPIFYHPDNNVDLVVIPINPLLDYFGKQNIHISYHTLDDTVVPNDSTMQTLNVIEDLFMIGHPAGLATELNGRPLVRKGVTATPMFFDHDNKKEFLLSIPVYDGSAGAPVLLYQSNYSNRFDAPRKLTQRVLLVGINAATYTKGFKEKTVPLSTHTIPYNAETVAPVLYEDIGIIIKPQWLFDFKKILVGQKK
jgi:hypothetical protein